MSESEKIRIWGIVRNKENTPIAYTWVKLLRKFYHHKHVHYEEIAETLSNSEGYYEFWVRGDKNIYKVLALKEEEKSENGEHEQHNKGC